MANKFYPPFFLEMEILARRVIDFGERAKNGRVLGVRVPENFLPASRQVFPARRRRRRAIYRVRFRFFDWWIKFGKIMEKVWRRKE